MATSVSASRFQVRVLIIFVTWMCLGSRQSVESKEVNATSNTFVVSYQNGVQAYLEENWEVCIKNFEDALQGYKSMKEATINCRIKCQNAVEESPLMFPENVENLNFYEKLVKKTLCLLKCKKVLFKNKEPILPKEMEDNFENLKAYEYIQLCYYQKNMVQKAASSVFTFLVVNPNHKSMLSNLKFYTSLPEVNVDNIVNFEVKPYVSLYVHGSEAYQKEDFLGVINYIEESLEEYLRAEEECRAFCEGPFDQGWYPDFTSSIANHFTYCLKCKRKCSLQLNTLNGEEHDDLLPSHYHFLQYAYFQVGNLPKACEAVESYLLFFPVDETMLSNKEYYKKMPKVKEEYFIPREEALKYVKRQEYETKLLSFIEKEFLFETDEGNVVDGYENESLESKELSGKESESYQYESRMHEASDQFGAEGRDMELDVRDQRTETLPTIERKTQENSDKDKDMKLDCSLMKQYSTKLQSNKLERFKQLLTELKQGRTKQRDRAEAAREEELQREKLEKRELKRQAVKYIQQLMVVNVTTVKGGDELFGTHRVLADGFADEHECRTLVELVKIAGVHGDGYKGKKSPHTEYEEFIGMSIGRAALMVYFGLLEPQALEYFLDVSERGRVYVEKYFKLKDKLYFNYAHLVCRTAIRRDDQYSEPHMSHPIHGDNCDVRGNGECIKQLPCFIWRDYSALIYLNDDFEGGEFVFATSTHPSSIQTSVVSKCGRMVAFTSGGENLHGVRGVTRGSRCAIGLWFTFDHKYEDVEHILAKQVLAQVKQNGTISDQMLNDLKMRTNFDVDIELKKRINT